MKKYLLIGLMAMLVTGFVVSCSDDAADENLYEQASDKDEEPDK